MTFTLVQLDNRIYLPFNKRNELNLLRKSKIKPLKIKIEREQTFKTFPRENF